MILGLYIAQKHFRCLLTHTVTCRSHLYDEVLNWMNGFIAHYTSTTRDYRQYNAIAILRTFQFTVTNALGFSVFISRILATGLSQSHCNFKPHIKCSFHRPISFFSLFCSCQFRRLDSVQFLCSQAHNPASWRLGTRLFASDSTTILS
jgi:hypothetical protein